MKNSFDTDTYYIVAAKTQEFDSNTIPEVSESLYDTFYKSHDEILFGKLVANTDVVNMVRKIDWVEGGTYIPYSHLTVDLHTKDFYVVSDQDDGSYGVFKCIHKPPFIEPTTFDKPLISEVSASDEIYITSDGYQWKYMFTIDEVNYNKYATENYVPIIENSNVVANAVSGTIDSIMVSNTGALYNSYASGRFIEINFGGNTLKHRVISDDYTEVLTYDLISSNGTFDTGAVSIHVDAETSNGTIHSVGTNSISIVIDDTTSLITKQTVLTSNVTVETANATATVINIRRESLPILSTANDFYNGCSLYIHTGVGGGQILDIDDYEFNSGSYYVTLNDTFTIDPDGSSYFKILPNLEIIGDGTGAKAIPKIDSTANTIVDVEVVNRGSGYTYASIDIHANTGILAANGDIVNPTSATLTPIIAPKGGHGSNAANELYGSALGISGSFVTTEVSSDYPFSKILLIRNPLLDGLEISFASYGSEFSNGELIIQDVTGAQGTISDIDGLNDVITLTNISGIFDASNIVRGQTSNNSLTPSSINNDMSTFNNVVELEVTVSTGTFQVGDSIANNGVSAYVAKVTANSLFIVDRFGTFSVDNEITGSLSGATATIDAVGTSDLIDNSGDIIYIETTEEITRTPSTTENIKLVLDI